MSKRLLITDDALIIRTIIRDVAEADGWEVVGEAANGQEAIDLYSSLQPDVTTMDLVMPGFDGLHGLAGIRACDPQAAVLVVSALDQSDVLKQAMQLGAGDFIVKPFEDERLCSALNCLHAHRQGIPVTS